MSRYYKTGESTLNPEGIMVVKEDLADIKPADWAVMTEKKKEEDQLWNTVGVDWAKPDTYTVVRKGGGVVHLVDKIASGDDSFRDALNAMRTTLLNYSQLYLASQHRPFSGYLNPGMNYVEILDSDGKPLKLPVQSRISATPLTMSYTYLPWGDIRSRLDGVGPVPVENDTDREVSAFIDSPLEQDTSRSSMRDLWNSV